MPSKLIKNSFLHLVLSIFQSDRNMVIKGVVSLSHSTVAEENTIIYEWKQYHLIADPEVRFLNSCLLGRIGHFWRMTQL